MRSYIVDGNILFSALYNPASRAGKMVLEAIEGSMVLHSTEHVKEEMHDLLCKKLEHTEEEAVAIVLDLPIHWMGRRMYMDLLNEGLVKEVGEADCSLVVCSFLLNHPLVTGDKRLKKAGSAIAQIISLKEVGN